MSSAWMRKNSEEMTIEGEHRNLWPLTKHTGYTYSLRNDASRAARRDEHRRVLAEAQLLLP
jgi:hypothetical protein